MWNEADTALWNKCGTKRTQRCGIVVERSGHSVVDHLWNVRFKIAWNGYVHICSTMLWHVRSTSSPQVCGRNVERNVHNVVEALWKRYYPASHRTNFVPQGHSTVLWNIHSTFLKMLPQCCGMLCGRYVHRVPPTSDRAFFCMPARKYLHV